MSKLVRPYFPREADFRDGSTDSIAGALVGLAMTLERGFIPSRQSSTKKFLTYEIITSKVFVYDHRTAKTD